MSPLDAGLQAERTALSWIRTSLGVAANGALLLRLGLVEHRRVEEIAGAVLLILAIAVYGLGTTRSSTIMARVRAGQSPAPPWLLLGISTLVILLAVVVLISLLP